MSRVVEPSQDASLSAGADAPTPRRPLRVTWVLPRSNLSGGVKSTRLLAEAFARRGHRAVLAYVEPKDYWPKPWQPLRLAGRLAKAIVGHGTRPHHLESSTATLLPLPGPHIDADQVPDSDVIVATFWTTARWIEDWPDTKGMKVYFIRHHEKHTGRKGFDIEGTYKLPYPKFVIARWLKDVMAREYGDDDATLVPNGVDWTTFDSTPRERNETPTIGLLYNAKPWKGVDTAFAAIRRAQQDHPDLRVISFGSEPLQPEHQPPANFTYHHQPTYQAIGDLYRACDGWIVPSTTEGFGMPGLEAAGCRCPIISTRCGGPEDYVREDESGYLVDVGDVDAMADRIRKLITLEPGQWVRKSEASYAIARGFSWDRSAERFEQKLYQLLGKEHA